MPRATLALLALAALTACFDDTPDANAAPTPPPEWAIVAAGQNVIKAQLNDPESAQFSDVAVYRGSGNAIVCGRVNAKNGFGGYVGPKRFYAGGIGAIDGQMRASLFDSLYVALCR